MRTITSILFLLFFVSSASAVPPKGTANWNGEEIRWYSYQAGLNKARKEKKAIIVVFHTNWCPYCKRYRRQFYDSQVVRLSKKFVFVMVDRDTERAVNDKYAPDGGYVPRTMVLNSKGVLDKSIHGGGYASKWNLDQESPRGLRAFLRKAARKYSKK